MVASFSKNAALTDEQKKLVALLGHEASSAPTGSSALSFDGSTDLFRAAQSAALSRSSSLKGLSVSSLSSTPANLSASGTTYRISRRSNQWISEGGNAVFRIHRSGDTTKLGFVRFYTSDGSARNGSDYNGQSRLILFGFGQTYKDVTVSTRTDTINEGIEYFSGRLSRHFSGDQISASSVNQYVLNVSPLYSITRRTGTYVKEGTNAVFRIYRDKNTSGTGYVRFYTSDGTARSGSDYNGTNRVITFRSGQTYQDVSVSTRTDSINEREESFYARISQYRSGDRISGSYAIQYITNVLPSSTYSISRRSSTYVNEGSNAVFRIYRSGNTSGTGYVRFYTSNGSARSGSDYNGTNRVVTFRSGQSYQDVSVGTRTDSIYEGNEYFWAGLSPYLSSDRISGSSLRQYIENVSSFSKYGSLAGKLNVYLADKVFSKSELQGLLSSVGKGGVTSNELTELRKLSTDLNGYLSSTTKDYYSYIFNSVVNGSVANNFYTAGTTSRSLGNLSVGSSESQVNTLISKWFGGSDRPTPLVLGDTANQYNNPSSSYYYKLMTGSLFENGACATDISQGSAGTCYFLAAAASVANQNSKLISQMFTDNKDGTYGVRFYSNSGSKIFVTVDKSALTRSGGDVTLASNADRKLSGEMWVSLLEKAYAQANEIGVFGRQSTKNAFSSIEGGLHHAIKHLTGESASYIYSPSHTYSSWSNQKSSVISKISANKIVFLGSYGDTYDQFGRKLLVKNHAFSITGYDSASDSFICRNPWGNGSSSYVGEFEVKWSDLYSNKSFVAFT